MSFQAQIRECVSDLPAHHVEARMHKLANLDELDATDFSATARKAAAWVDEVGPERSEELARSYGITEDVAS